MRYAVIDDKTKTVANIIEIDEGSSWTPPEGHSVVKSNVARMGDTYADRKFTTPAPVVEIDPDVVAYKKATLTSKKVAIIAKRLGLVP